MQVFIGIDAEGVNQAARAIVVDGDDSEAQPSCRSVGQDE
jgi:hypothetical protein